MAEQETELVQLNVSGAIATITLQSEHNRNALSRQLMTELSDRLAQAEQDDRVRVIVLRSAHRVFCSGADLSEAASGEMVQGARALVAIQRQMAASRSPIVVELAGPVRAGGLGIVGAADIVVAGASVTFALTEVRLGLAPAVISLTLLERLADRAASDLLLTGRTFDAQEAQTAGLVTHAVPDSELSRKVGSVAADLSRGYPQGLGETKRLINRDLIARIDALGDQVAQRSAELFASDEARQAMAAFLQPRLP